jgi:hypothetical protein
VDILADILSGKGEVMSEHSKGSWRTTQWNVTYINDHKHHYIGIVNDIPDGEWAGTGIAACIMPEENDTPRDRRIVKANARLIAASPALLLELKNIANADLRKWDDGLNTPDEFVLWAQSRARAAIAAAEG